VEKQKPPAAMPIGTHPAVKAYEDLFSKLTRRQRGLLDPPYDPVSRKRWERECQKRAISLPIDRAKRLNWIIEIGLEKRAEELCQTWAKRFKIESKDRIFDPWDYVEAEFWPDYHGLSTRARNCLYSSGLRDKQSVLTLLDDKSLKKIRNLGKKTYREILHWLGIEEPPKVLCPHCGKPIATTWMLAHWKP
jgi:hypothetical protein